MIEEIKNIMLQTVRPCMSKTIVIENEIKEYKIVHKKLGQNGKWKMKKEKIKQPKGNENMQLGKQKIKKMQNY